VKDMILCIIIFWFCSD